MNIDQPLEAREQKLKNGGSAGSKAILLSLRGLVEVYGLTIWFWRTAIWRGDIPHLKLGRKLVVDRRDVDIFIEKNKVIEGSK
jgi:hypothetical protein